MWGDLLTFLGAIFGGERDSNLLLLKVTLLVFAIAAGVLGLVILLN